MQRLFHAALLLAACSAAPQDLSGKVFNFPAETKTAHVTLKPSKENFNSVSVCLRYFTDIKRSYSLFSVATPSHQNEFLLFKNKNIGQFDYLIRDKGIAFWGHPEEVISWHSICATWDSNTGIGQPWFNGKPGSRKFIYQGDLGGRPIIVLGQEQDSHGGDFDINQSFFGLTTDVHMWDYVLSTCEIQRFMSNINFTPGNIINWRSLEFNITGNVAVEEKQPDNC
ncbi:mucosal pentraxin-like [Denticeps clupeoides]|uniref:Pentraxin family member n=1 Tax=Denticeps clupeoides TaxID=299321 RepID=A0AAY4EQE1_9TELE|nr:mucosal pentraxin-like [Denticeps clupeoides]